MNVNNAVIFTFNECLIITSNNFGEYFQYVFKVTKEWT